MMAGLIKFNKASKNKNMKRYYELKKQNKKGNMRDIVTKFFLKEKRKRKAVKEEIFVEIFVTIKKKKLKEYGRNLCKSLNAKTILLI